MTHQRQLRYPRSVAACSLKPELAKWAFGDDHITPVRERTAVGRMYQILDYAANSAPQRPLFNPQRRSRLCHAVGSYSDAADHGKVLTDGSANKSIDSDTRWRKELWTLNQTGNWSSHSIGDNSGGNNELAETGTFNTANEWTGRSRTTPSASPTSDTLTYDKVGNMTTNGKGEKLVYDGFGRLREVRLTAESDRLITSYRYNGLGMRISQAINLSSGSSDNDVTDAEDSLTFFANDERWRIAAAYSSSGSGGTGSASLLERYVHHAAGQAGSGASSYIDAVVLRDRDLDTEESSTVDGGTDPLEERTYILQNWRADVVATARRNGSVIEKMQYTAYGAAVTHLFQGTVRGDFDANGGVDGSDLEAFELAWENGEPSTDVNFDGGITSADLSAFLVIWATGELSTDIYESHAGACQTTAVRFGYAGYVRDGSANGDRVYTDAAAGLYHVRHRVYDPESGRWTRRDALGYIDGLSLYQYCRAHALSGLDPTGERSESELTYEGPSACLGGPTYAVFGHASSALGYIGVPTGAFVLASEYAVAIPSFPWHGNWCGPGYGGNLPTCTDEKRGVRPDVDPREQRCRGGDANDCPTIDPMDVCCKDHDKCYYDTCISFSLRKSDCQRVCDGRICECLNKLRVPGRSTCQEFDNWAMRMLFCSGNSSAPPNANEMNCKNKRKDQKRICRINGVVQVCDRSGMPETPREFMPYPPDPF